MDKIKLLEYYKMAQNNIKKIKEFYNNNIDLFDTHNLKMYDAFYYQGSDEMKKDLPLCFNNYIKRLQDSDYDYFSQWCQREYDFFINEYDFSENVKYIGRTSSFYFVPEKIKDYIDSTSYTDEFNFVQDVFNYIVDECNAWDELKLTKNYNIKLINYDVLNYQESFESVCVALEDFANFDIELLFADCVTIYEYITDFRKGQVNNFKLYLEDCENDLQIENETNNTNYNALKKCIEKGLENGDFTEEETYYINNLLQRERGEILCVTD